MGADKVDINLVAIFSRFLSDFEGRLLIAQHIDHCLYIFWVYIRNRTRDLHFTQISELNFGVNFKNSCVLKILAFAVVDIVDARLTYGAQVFLLNGFVEARVDDLTNHFLTHTSTELLLNHLQGNLAFTEAFDGDGLGGFL